MKGGEVSCGIRGLDADGVEVRMSLAVAFDSVVVSSVKP